MYCHAKWGHDPHVLWKVTPESGRRISRKYALQFLPRRKEMDLAGGGGGWMSFSLQSNREGIK